MSLRTPIISRDRVISLSNVGTTPAVTAATGVGASPFPGVYVSEEAGEGLLRMTKISFVAAAFPMGDGTSHASYLGQTIYKFPVGLVLEIGAVLDIVSCSSVGGATGLNTGAAFKIAVGSVTQVAAGTQATTNVDHIASQSATFTAFAAAAFTASRSTVVQFGTASTGGSVYLNLGAASTETTTTGADTVTITGSYTFAWLLQGKTGQ